MLTPRRRLAIGLICVTPTAFGPALVASAAPAPAAATTAAVASDTAPAAGDPRPTPRPTPKPPRWRAYVSQKVVWSAKSCTPDTRAAAKQVSTKKNPVAVECARLITPIDWSDLSKGAMNLHVARVKQVVPKGKKAAPARMLLVNPGGPGGASAPFAAAVAATKPALRLTHDVVGVDPRGTGGSTPLDCPIGLPPVPDSRVDTPKARAAAQAAYRKAVQACVKKQGRYLPHITTANTVHDQDLVRRLMGARTADWFGVSGGSWMGAWFAHLHPASLDRVVLDANTEFTTDWRTSFSGFAAGFQRRYEAMFLPWAARNNAKLGLGKDAAAVNASYEKIRAAAGKGKIKEVTPNALDALSMMMLYQDGTFPLLGQMLSETNAELAKKGRATFNVPKELGDESSADPSMATVRTAILCNDTSFRRDPASLFRDLRADAKKNPMVGYTFEMIMGPCAYWPYAPKAAPNIDGSVGPMKLMVQTELDPATPIEGARRAHAKDARTRMLFVDNQGTHGGYLTQNTCVDKTVTGYLTTGTLPAKDTTCPGVPLPGDKKALDYRVG